ncbi:hypothetical protein APHAL10511_005666 [Amanita phalloides]|nr:hypothetical protein APHAL10511_005666 [Amanita phalloides]
MANNIIPPLVLADDQTFRRQFNNFVRRRHLSIPEWKDKEIEVGWKSTVQLDGTPIGEGTARSKGGAREIAASEAFQYLINKYGNV